MIKFIFLFCELVNNTTCHSWMNFLALIYIEQAHFFTG